MSFSMEMECDTCGETFDDAVDCWRCRKAELAALRAELAAEKEAREQDRVRCLNKHRDFGKLEYEWSKAREERVELRERVRVLEQIVRRAANELEWFNSHGDECEARFQHDCEICESTDEADEHCTCFLALRRDLAALGASTDKDGGG